MTVPIFHSDPLVKALETRGWLWGGHWQNKKDYMHFSTGEESPGGGRSGFDPTKAVCD